MKRVNDVIVLTAEEYEALLNKNSTADKPSFWHRLCCSKKVLFLSWSASIIMTIICVVAFFLTDKDTSLLSVIVGLVWGVTAADTAVYSWKAKAENKIKLTKAMVSELADKYGIEAVVSLLGITLSE